MEWECTREAAAAALEEREDLKKIEMSDAPAKMPIIRIFPDRIRYLSVPEGILNQELDLTR